MPGGWSHINKIHFIGHSQGAQTIRYLQYLMKIDYFAEGVTKEDQSDLFASITCLNPILNGSIAPYFCSFDPWEDRFKCPDTDNGRLVDSWFVKGCKAFSIASNLLVPGHS